MKKVLLKKLIVYSGLLPAALSILPYAYAQDPALHWIRQQGGTDAEQALGVSTNGSDLVYTTGTFRGTVNFDRLGSGTALSAVSEQDIYVACHHAQGHLLWVRSAGVSGVSEGLSVTSGGDGSVYVSGSFSDSIDFGQGIHILPATGGSDAFIWKLDSRGNTIWARSSGTHTGSGGNKTARSIATDASGNVFISGADSGRIFLAGMDSAGNFKWSRILPGTKELDYSNAIAVSDAGMIYITGGYESDSVNMDPGATDFHIRNTGQNVPTKNLEIFVAAYDTSGAFHWANTYGGVPARARVSPIDQGYGIHISRSGALLIAAVYGNTINLNPGQQPVSGVNTLSAQANQDGLILKLDPVSGAFIWGRRLGGIQNQLDMTLISVYAHSITTDPDENIFVTGNYNGNIDFNPGLTNADTFYLRTTEVNGQDMFVLKLDQQGTFVWAESYGTRNHSDFTGYARGMSITTDTFSNVYAAGRFRKRVLFDEVQPGGIMESEGESDIFLIKLNQCPDTSLHYTSYKGCGSEVTIEGRTYNEPGSYAHVHRNASGCDSTTFFELELFNEAAPDLDVKGAELFVTREYPAYQWYLNDTLLPGETGSTLTVTENGNYHVVVTSEQGCEYTSGIYFVNNVSVTLHSREAEEPTIYPNPSSSLLHIRTADAAAVLVTGTDGRILYRAGAAKTHTIPVSGWSPGIYLIGLQHGDGRNTVRRITKN